MRSKLVLLLCLGLAAGACAPGRSASAACTGTDVELLSEGQLVVATDASFPPFALRDAASGETTGFEVELVRELAQRMNLEVRFVDRTYPSLLPGLVSRRFDVVAAALRSTPEVSEQVCTTRPHLDADLALAVRLSSEITEVADLDGRTVGVERGTPAAAWARDRLPEANVVAYATADDPFVALASGDVDAVVHDAPLAVHQQRIRPEVVVVEEVSTGDGYVLAVHPENRGLRDASDAALEMLREDGTYDRVYERWFGRR